MSTSPREKFLHYEKIPQKLSWINLSRNLPIIISLIIFLKLITMSYRHLKDTFDINFFKWLKTRFFEMSLSLSSKLWCPELWELDTFFFTFSFEIALLQIQTQHKIISLIIVWNFTFFRSWRQSLLFCAYQWCHTSNCDINCAFDNQRRVAKVYNWT